MTEEAKTLAPTATSGLHAYRCIDGDHEFDQWRSLRAPLAVRQTSWCAEHGCSAMLLSTRRDALAARHP